MFLVIAVIYQGSGDPPGRYFSIVDQMRFPISFALNFKYRKDLNVN